MEEKKDGWVKLHRKIYSHWLFQENRVFSKLEAWIDLVMMVNHADGKTLMDGQVMPVKRGSTVTSVRKLCDRWGWSNTKVRKFLDVLESEEMLTVKSDTKKTLLTVVNYEKFQSRDKKETTQERHENDVETSQKHTNKNEEELKNDKEQYIPFGEIIDYLNEKTGKKFKNVEAHRKHIRARWNEGYPLDDFKMVIDKKVNHWKGDAKMDKYLKPDTLFRIANFDNYRNESWENPYANAGNKGSGINPDLFAYAEEEDARSDQK